MPTSPQTLTVEDRQLVASWAADCAEHVLAIYETAVPSDTRVRDAIGQARAFASGELSVADAIRCRGGDAGAAAREAPTSASKAAAYAAEQAAAVAHMGAHALGAAGYAAKASTLDVGCDGDEATRAEASRQVAAMGDAVARVLACLPALGENHAGPLGPGRLSSGHVGQTIRAIQASVDLHLAGQAHRSESSHSVSPATSATSVPLSDPETVDPSSARTN
ncbi:putative immunity protein [Ilumatobacter sp.]|uniref:putative immunity protein n=1 Tax=Ilumatobacter sp. TaxID=1967498 RepID=UPI003C6B7177